MSMQRLRAGFGSDFDKLLGELTSDPGQPEPFRFAPRALFGHEAFLRGLELLRLGLGGEARREFQSIGIAVPEERGVVAGSAESEELLWLAAVLFDRAGAWHLSHFIPRHVLTEWQRHYPVGAWRKQWLLAYPRGFSDLLAQSARENGQPEALQLAIVREESAFDPRTESFANAVGLTQMIQPTAKRFSAGLPYDRESLRDPAINVAIGGRFLGFLFQLWQQNPALTISSYNAGEGAVVRWLKAQPPPSGEPPTALPQLSQIDLFIESIPFDETRGYTKRVLSSYLIYTWLYAPLPSGAPLDSRLPAILFPLPPPPKLRG
jgi:soluble lytic murein transglycosylase